MTKAERQILAAMVPGKTYTIQSAAMAGNLSVAVTYNALRALGKEDLLLLGDGEVPLWTKAAGHALGFGTII